ncbi:MAG: pyridoxamine 5'-phosphate oxidase family protein [Methylococcaceae bacterium]|jgi:hypothetical protein
MSEIDKINEKSAALLALTANQQTLLLSTASLSGEPDLSYAPFVRDPSGNFYIFISELALHTRNLQANPKASVMFISPESKSPNLFARERVIYTCSAQQIARNEPRYNTQLLALQEHFGSIITMLSSLSDFHLFTLCPANGRYIAGFGQAYDINSVDGSLTLVTGKKP